MCRVRGGAALRALAGLAAFSAADVSATPTPTPGVVNVHGVLVRRGLGLGPEVDAIVGLATYSDVVSRVRAAVSDASVPAVVLSIDSPGGEVAGLLDAADAIRAERSSKPIIAVSEGVMASAAYVLGAAASKVVLSRTAYAGSVGVVVEHEDVSGAMAMAGVKVDLIHAGAKKVDGDPSRPLSPDARADMQARVDAAWQMLCESVGASRGMKPEAVKALEAGIYRGQDAIAAGLADEIGTVAGVLAGLSRQNTAAGSRSSPFGARAPWPNKHARAFA